jgi:hypothetical protein
MLKSLQATDSLLSNTENSWIYYQTGFLKMALRHVCNPNKKKTNQFPLRPTK